LTSRNAYRARGASDRRLRFVVIGIIVICFVRADVIVIVCVGAHEFTGDLLVFGAGQCTGGGSGSFSGFSEVIQDDLLKVLTPYCSHCQREADARSLRRSSKRSSKRSEKR